jgi:hypothetical protein
VCVGDQEQIFRTLAEGRDARIVHAHMLLTQHVGDIGEQPGAVGADEAHPRTPAVGRRFQTDPRCDPEMFEMARLRATRRQKPVKIAGQYTVQIRFDLLDRRWMLRIARQHVERVENQSMRAIERTRLQDREPKTIEGDDDRREQTSRVRATISPDALSCSTVACQTI